jgi:hypothetical protein
VDAALKIMTKNVIRHYPKTDDFCLTHEEIQNLSEKVAHHDYLYRQLSSNIEQIIIEKIGNKFFDNQIELLEMLTTVAKEIIQKYLFSRGEDFASFVAKGGTPKLAKTDLDTILAQTIQSIRVRKIGSFNIHYVLEETINTIFQYPNQITKEFLRIASDSYTLMAFLKQTPDVQRSVRKIFQSADIWIDTTIILPIFAETLIEEEENRYYSAIISAAKDSKINLYVTPGVIEEINTHMNRCLSCASHEAHSWVGTVPFLLSLYITSGRNRSSFTSWIETFKGTKNPEDDIADYLKTYFSIKIMPLEKESSKVSDNLRYAVQEVWRENHTRRKHRYANYEMDDITLGRLIAHDVENYLGILGLRSNHDRLDVGYSHWWLTIDSIAYKMQDEIIKFTDERIPHSPVMSLDFLANFLSFSLLRVKHSQKNLILPIFIDYNFPINVPPELIAIADQAREKCAGLPEHVVRRTVRDRLDEEKNRLGHNASGGYNLIRQTIEDAL